MHKTGKGSRERREERNGMVVGGRKRRQGGSMGRDKVEKRDKMVEGMQLIRRIRGGMRGGRGERGGGELPYPQYPLSSRPSLQQPLAPSRLLPHLTSPDWGENGGRGREGESC